MANNELADLCLQGHRCRIAGGGVHCFYSPLPVLVYKGGFVIKQVDASNLINERFCINRIGAKGVAARRAWVEGKLFIADFKAGSGDERGSAFNICNDLYRDIIFPDLFGQNLTKAFFFAEKETRGWDPVLKNYGFDRKQVVFENQAGLISRHMVKDDLVTQLGFCMAEMRPDNFFHTIIAIYMERSFPVIEVKRSEQANQAKEMVAMNMGDKNMVEPASFDIVPGHLHLRSFTTVQQKAAAVIRQVLCGRVAVVSRYSAVAAQNGKFKMHHSKLSPQVAVQFFHHYKIHRF